MIVVVYVKFSSKYPAIFNPNRAPKFKSAMYKVNWVAPTFGHVTFMNIEINDINGKIKSLDTDASGYLCIEEFTSIIRGHTNLLTDDIVDFSSFKQTKFYIVPNDTKP